MRRFLNSVMRGERRDLAALLVTIPLAVLSVLYGLAVRVVLECYKSGIFTRRKLDVPVISVGNLTMGGVGKTPMVIELVRMLRGRKIKPVVLTRGYGAEKGLSDEAEMLKDFLKDVPVVVNPNRFEGGLDAIKRFHPDVFILDDGFQHWKLERDLDIVLIDAARPFGNGCLLPAGILREPLSSLKRADVLVLTKTDRADISELKKQLALLCPGTPIVETVHKPKSLSNVYTDASAGLDRIVGPVVAFCAIGDPLSFKSLLIDLGADVKEFVHFIDHHCYSAEDINTIKNACDTIGVRTVVTTAKDAVKLNAFKDAWNGYDVFVLNIQIEIIQGEQHLADGINRLLHR